MSVRARRFVATASVFAVGMAVIVGAAPAHADDGPMCGEVITVDTVLTADLLCDGTTDGLIIGAAGVTLDLKGHTIAGPGPAHTMYSGVRVAGHADVTVTRGTISGFQAGVVLDQAWGATVSKLTAAENTRGVNIAGGGGHLVTQSTIVDNDGDGIRLGLSTGNAVHRNTVAGNTWGISVADGSSDNVVSRNTVSASRANGLAAFAGATGTSFEQNTVSGSWQAGIIVTGDTSATTLSQNKSNANIGTGIVASHALVVKNTTVDNGGQGIVAVASTDGGGNKAAGNLGTPQCEGVVCSAP